MSGVILTEHAKLRIAERCTSDFVSTRGGEKRALAKQAYTRGIQHFECSGALKKYVSRLYLKYEKANNIRLYEEYVFLFEGINLITVLNLPECFIDTVSKLQERVKFTRTGRTVPVSLLSPQEQLDASQRGLFLLQDWVLEAGLTKEQQLTLVSVAGGLKHGRAGNIAKRVDLCEPVRYLRALVIKDKTCRDCIFDINTAKYVVDETQFLSREFVRQLKQSYLLVKSHHPDASVQEFLNVVIENLVRRLVTTV